MMPLTFERASFDSVGIIVIYQEVLFALILFTLFLYVHNFPHILFKHLLLVFSLIKTNPDLCVMKTHLPTCIHLWIKKHTHIVAVCHILTHSYIHGM